MRHQSTRRKELPGRTQKRGVNATFGPRSRRGAPCCITRRRVGSLAYRLASGAPGRHARGRYGARQPVAELSWDQAVHDHLLKDAARSHRHPVIVSAINSAKLPASTAAVEVLKEAVPRATPCVCLDGV